jgi:hypothetical protein
MAGADRVRIVAALGVSASASLATTMATTFQGGLDWDMTITPAQTLVRAAREVDMVPAAVTDDDSDGAACARVANPQDTAERDIAGSGTEQRAVIAVVGAVGQMRVAVAPIVIGRGLETGTLGMPMVVQDDRRRRREVEYQQCLDPFNVERVPSAASPRNGPLLYPFLLTAGNSQAANSGFLRRLRNIESRAMPYLIATQHLQRCIYQTVSTDKFMIMPESLLAMRFDILRVL